MREKHFYIEEIARYLDKCDTDTVKAVYKALSRITRGEYFDGLKK